MSGNGHLEVRNPSLCLDGRKVLRDVNIDFWAGARPDRAQWGRQVDAGQCDHGACRHEATRNPHVSGADRGRGCRVDHSGAADVGRTACWSHALVAKMIDRVVSCAATAVAKTRAETWVMAALWEDGTVPGASPCGRAISRIVAGCVACDRRASGMSATAGFICEGLPPLQSYSPGTVLSGSITCGRGHCLWGIPLDWVRPEGER